MLRSISTAPAIAVSLAFAPAVFAEPITNVEHVKVGEHTEVTTKDTVHPKTGVIDIHTRIAKTAEDGVTKVKTVSEKETPASTGGHTFSKTVTGFDGKARTTTGTVAAGHASASAGPSGHGGHRG